MPTAYLIVSLIGLLFTLNAFRPLRAEVFSVFTFFAGWLTSELPIHHLLWQLIATALFSAGGALDGWQGWAGLALSCVSWIGLLLLAKKATEAGGVVDEALRRDLGVEPPEGLPTTRQWAHLALPFMLRDSRVEAIKGVPYIPGAQRSQQLDIYRPRAGAQRAPVLVYIHGGGWVLGDKREQGLPMMLHLAARGWVCVTVNYRLSPKVAFPEHLLDCKRALAWTKDHIAEYGGDPSRVVISGGSAGGHLASLVALTPTLGDPATDLSVLAAVPFYGVYDFLNRDGVRGNGFGKFIDRAVTKTTPTANRELYELASPMDQITPDAPPFFVIHGSNDSLVPVQEARTFVRLLRERSHAPVVYAELPGAQHAFEVFRSIRTAEVLPRVETFLNAVLAGVQST